MYALPFEPTAKVIELGGGDQPLFRPNVDVRFGPFTDFTANFEEPLPITSLEWDGVFCKFALEHISWRCVKGFLAETHRILKPGGQAVFITANGEAQMRWALQFAERGDWDERVSQCLGGDQEHPDNTHKVFFNPTWIAKLLAEIGFTRVLVFPFGELKTDMLIEAKK